MSNSELEVAGNVARQRIEATTNGELILPTEQLTALNTFHARPDPRFFPLRQEALHVVPSTDIAGPQFPATGLQTDTTLAAKIAEICSLVPFHMGAASQDAMKAEIAAHFDTLTKKAFEFEDNRLAVAVDAAYLTFEAEGKQHAIELSNRSRYGGVDTAFDLLRRMEIPRAQLHLAAGYFDGRKSHSVWETLDVAIRKEPSGNSLFPWESHLSSTSAPSVNTESDRISLAEQRQYRALGFDPSQDPEVGLAAKLKALQVPSPRVEAKPLIIVGNDAKTYAELLKADPTREQKHDFLSAARDLIHTLEGQYREASAGPGAAQTRAYQIGLVRRPTGVDPILPRSVLPSDDPFSDYWIQATARGYLNTAYLTSPQMLRSHKEAAQQSWKPVPYKDIQPIITRHRKGEIISYPEVGPSARGQDIPDHMDDSTSRALLRMWTTPFLGHTARPFVGSSMNYLFSSRALVEGALGGTAVWIPCDGEQASLEAQKTVFDAFHEELKNHPIIKNYPYPHARMDVDEQGNESGEYCSSYLYGMAKSQLGVTIKPYPAEKALEAVKYFIERGVTNFRLYDPGSTPAMVETAQKIMAEYRGKINLVAGQVTTVEQARALQECGCAGLIVGIGWGGHCTTASELGLYPPNFGIVAELVHAGINIPIIADGGPGPESAATVLMLGADAVMVSGSIFGGTFEHGPFNWYVDQKGDHSKLTHGEAAELTKALGNHRLGSGLLWNVEGVDGLKFLRPTEPTTSGKLIDKLAKLAKVLRFQRYGGILEARLDPWPELCYGNQISNELRYPHVHRPPHMRAPRLSALGDRWSFAA